MEFWKKIKNAGKAVADVAIVVDTFFTGVEEDIFGKSVDKILDDAADKVVDKLSGPASATKDGVSGAAKKAGGVVADLAKKVGTTVADHASVTYQKGQMAKKRSK